MDIARRPNLPSTLDPKSLAGQFEKDLHFFQLLLVLINKSCPIKSVDLMWKSSESDESGLTQITGTAQALQGVCSRLVCCKPVKPSPKFCQIVSAGCATSDKAAATRVGATGRPEVYRCHAGLVDIAVPVMCDGVHIATLFTGQVLRSRPNAAGFRAVRREVRHLGVLDLRQLKAAYQQVPVVSEKDIQHTVGILEIFAEYLATAWKRLLDAIEAQQLRLRDSQLLRKEMAYIILGGYVEESKRLREIARAMEFTSYPNQIMIVRPQEEVENGALPSSFDLAFTRALYALEDLTGRMKNVLTVYLRGRGICILFADDGGRTSRLSEVRTYALAQRVMTCIHQQGDLRIRIGVGRPRKEWHRLAESYQEAWTALAASEAAIALYQDPPAAVRALSGQMEIACQALMRRNFQQARSTLQSVPMLANRHLGSNVESLSALRQFFLSAMDALMLTAQRLGCDTTTLGCRREAWEKLEVAPTVFELQESWLNCVERLMADIGRLYSGKHEKLVARARDLIDGNIERAEGSLPVSIPEVAALLGVSQGHLSRTFKKIAGVTLERYVMEKRIERAQRLLLDPSSRVSEVAEKCDFCNPAYFARVFRKIAGCSPSDFSTQPNRYKIPLLSTGVTMRGEEQSP
jgi:AraC-like DNA-binding protein/ligand-binding sensor protein/sugar diacid utilization regulator